MVHELPRRAHRLPVDAGEALGQDDGVGRLLPQRQDGPHDQRVRLQLVPGHQVFARVVGVQRVDVGVVEDPVVVGVLTDVELAVPVEVLLVGLEQQRGALDAGIVGEVLAGADEIAGVAAVTDVEVRGLAVGGRAR